MALFKIPEFVLRQQLRPWGRRFPKRGERAEFPGFQPRVYGPKKCTKCDLPILEGGVFREFVQYHFVCEPEYRPATNFTCNEQYVKEHRQRMRDYRASRTPNVLDEIPDGNLVSNDEYRFWVGCVATNTGFSQCRCCKRIVHSGEERLAHKNTIKGQAACTTLLTVAYDRLALRNKCVVCESQTWNRRWGVPLCHATMCIKRWMFDTTHWVSLEMALMGEDRAQPKIVDAAALVGEGYDD